MSKNKLNKQQWDHLRDKLGLYRSIYLMIDGIPVSVSEARNGQRIVIELFICSWFKGIWLEDHFFTKYLREVKKALYSKKEMEKWYKMWKTLEGKKAADERKKNAYITYRTPVFPSLKNFQRHMNKVAERIEIIPDHETYTAYAKDYQEKHPEYFKSPEATNG